MRDRPELRNLPVAVGGDRPRSVVCTCNYRAREFGVGSAMPVFLAMRNCPALQIVRPRMDHYAAVSRQIRAIFERFSSQIEPLSLDEAYLDVSDRPEPAAEIASNIRLSIRRELRLPSSAGIGPNKLVAKIASAWNKPNGQFEVLPHEVDSFIADLPVRKLWGVGPRMGESLRNIGVRTAGDLRRFELSDLLRRFGKFGAVLYQMCRGTDDRPVETERIRKSLGVERTCTEEIEDLSTLHERIRDLHRELMADYACRSLPPPAGLTVKLKFKDFRQTTLSRSSDHPNLDTFIRMATAARKRSHLPIRLVGISLRFSGDPDIRQLTLNLNRDG